MLSLSLSLSLSDSFFFLVCFSSLFFSSLLWIMFMISQDLCIVCQFLAGSLVLFALFPWSFHSFDQTIQSNQWRWDRSTMIQISKPSFKRFSLARRGGSTRDSTLCSCILTLSMCVWTTEIASFFQFLFLSCAGVLFRNSSFVVF